MPATTYTSRVLSIRDVAPDVRELTLSAPHAEYRFIPGQWTSLHLPIGEKPPLVRAYSFAAPPLPNGELALCLDRVPDGLGSGYLFDALPGAELTIGDPLGNFVVPEDPNEMLWVARYTGIVPFRAMLLDLRDHPPAVPVTLFYEAQRPEDLAYHAELVRLAEELTWFELVAAVLEPDSDWAGHTGPVFGLVQARVGERTDLTPMICGTREFVRALRDLFYGLGYDRKSVKWENFD